MTLFFTVLLSVAGYSLLNISQAGQKMGLGIKKNGHPRRGWIIWCIATFFSVVAVGAIIYALSSGNVSIVGSMAGTGLIALAVFSVLVLKEEITFYDIIGISLIIPGSIVTGIFAIENHDKTFHPWLIHGITAGFVILCAAGWLAGRKTRFSGFIAGGSSGIFAGVSMFYQKALLNSIQIDAQLLGDLVSVKTVLSFIRAGGIYGVLWILLTILSFITLQFAYKYGKAVHIIPAYNVSIIIIPVAGGALIFSEQITILQLLGIGIIVAGVVFLSLSLSYKRKKK